MSEKSEQPIELYPEDLQYLVEMAQKYVLEDASKAVRCLVAFAKENADQEKDIFDTIRCHHC